MIVWDWLKKKRVIDISLKKRTEGDVTVIYGNNLEMCYLNKVGGDFLALSSDNVTIEEISNIFLRKYDVSADTLQNDLIEIIRDLQWKRIIRLED